MSTRLFVGNLAFTTSLSLLEAHCQAVRGLVNVEMKLKIDGKNSGVAFLTFDTPENAKQGLESLNQTTLDGRSIVVREDREPAAAKGPSEAEIQSVSKSGSLFVGGLPEYYLDSDVVTFFSQFGEVKACTLLEDRTTRKSKCSAFVDFKNPADAVTVMKATHTIEGKTLRIAARTGTGEKENKTPRYSSNPGPKPVAPPKPTTTPATAQSIKTAEFIAQSKQEIDILRYFEVYVKGMQKSSEWVEYKKGSNVQRELQLQAEIRSLSLSNMISQLEAGACQRGVTRARLLEMWLTLIDNSESHTAFKFKDANQEYVTFRFAFISSKAIELLVMSAIDFPFETTNPASPGKTSVRDLVLALFNRVLVAQHVHKDLLEGIEALASLGQSVPHALKQQISDFFSCFKIDVTQSQSYKAQLDAVDAAISAAETNHETPRKMLTLLQNKWEVVLRLAGLGGAQSVGAVYHRLCTELDSLCAANVAALNEKKNDVARLDSAVQQIHQSVQSELASSGQELEIVAAQVISLTAKRDQLKEELHRTIEEITKLSTRQAELSKLKEGVMSRHGPTLSDIEKRKSSLTADVSRTEETKTVLTQAAAFLDRTHTFLCSHVKERNTIDRAQFPELVSKSVSVALINLKAILDEIGTLQKKADFCKRKLASMRLEYQEMLALDMKDVAQDLDQGITKLSKELDSVHAGILEKIKDGNNVFSWISTLKETDMLADKDIVEVVKLHKQIEGLKPRA